VKKKDKRIEIPKIRENILKACRHEKSVFCPKKHRNTKNQPKIIETAIIFIKLPLGTIDKRLKFML